MTEEELRSMKLNEVMPDGNGNRYTRVPCGWIFTSFSGQICFIPDIGKSSVVERVVKKDLTTDSPVRKSRTTK